MTEEDSKKLQTLLSALDKAINRYEVIIKNEVYAWDNPKSAQHVVLNELKALRSVI